MPNGTDAPRNRQAYHSLARAPGDWVVVSGPGCDVNRPMLSGFKTEMAAKEAADTLNGLKEDGGRTDDVLRQMLSGSAKTPPPK